MHVFEKLCFKLILVIDTWGTCKMLGEIDWVEQVPVVSHQEIKSFFVFVIYTFC